MNTILIIEDDRTLSEALSILLEKAGYGTERITDFKDVLPQMKESAADLILLDISLQGEIVSRDELMTALWDNDEFLNDNALSVNISRLRGKLSALGIPDAIGTRKKQGYLLK